MAYNPYNAANYIYNLKNTWSTSNASGDIETRDKAAADAQKYYNQLRENGYGDVADKLSNAGLEESKKILNGLLTTGKTATRKYFYDSGKPYGMSESDIDKLISWDNITGEVSFGGKKIGRPDAAVDGVSYWDDTSVLDDAFNDYIERSGTTRSKTAMVNQENESLFKKYNQEYEDLKSTNPFTTEEAKAILAKYDLAGLQGRDNAVASEAGSNGGNIDSFAAANALRQQSALVSQGQQVVLDRYQQKLDHARSLLSDMGVHIDRVYEQDETSKANDVALKSEIATVTGYSPDEWVVSNNPYMNDDGTIKDAYKDVDFASVMADAKAAGNTAAYEAAAVARYYKIMGNYGLYGQYDDGDYMVPDQKRTAEYDLTKQQIDSAKEIALDTNQTEQNIAYAENSSNEKMTNATLNAEKELATLNAEKELASVNSGAYTPSLTKSEVLTALEKGETSQTVIDAYNYYYGADYTTDNPPPAANIETEDYVTIKGYNETRAQQCGVDTCGQRMIDALIEETSSSAGLISVKDLVDYVVYNSAACHTNKGQLEKVFNYLGIDTRYLDDVEDVETGTEYGYRRGVRYVS